MSSTASKPASSAQDASHALGLVLSSSGRHCWVQTESGRLLCHPRGKKSEVLVGDRVRWQATGDEGVIESIEPRRNVFYRQDEMRTKRFAANIDQLVFFIAAEPEFSERQLTRALIAAEAAAIPSCIVVNKSDLTDAFARAWQRLTPYRAMGYSVLALSLKGDYLGLEALCQQLRGKTNLILGPSGAGKSSLINRLVPDAAEQTQEISQALNSGKHTTTRTTWHWAAELGADTALIDSPGFQEFGLHHIEAVDLARWMPDFAPHLGQCKFYNCTHLHEPGCGLSSLVGDAINPQRYEIYQMLFDELSHKRRI